MNKEASNTQHSTDEEPPKDELRKLQLVRAGSVHFGILADEITSIVPWREPTPLPQAPKPVLGVVSVQGRMLTVLDLTALAGGETVSREAASNIERRIIALRGDEQLALAVDAAGDTVRMQVLELKPPPENASPLILGTLRIEESEINILNLRDVFPAAIQGRERRRRRF